MTRNWKYITTNEAISGNYKYYAISYVWQQYQTLKKIEAKIEEYFNLEHVGDSNDEQIQKRGEYGMMLIWLDRVSNRDISGVNSLEGIRVMNKVYQQAEITVALVPELNDSLVSEEKIRKDANKLPNANAKYAIDNSLEELLKKEVAYIGWQRYVIRYVDKLQTLTKKSLVYSLMTSEWMRRTWTLQEQVLSSKIKTKVHDEIIDITQLVYSIISMNMQVLSEQNILYAVGRPMYSYRDGKISRETAIEALIKNMINYRWIDADQLVNHDYQKFINFKNKCHNSNLSILEALSATEKRIMGYENKGFEPVESLLSDNITDNMTQEYYLKTIIHNSDRSNIKNYSWLPKRLRTEQQEYITDLKFTLCHDNYIRMNESQYIIDHTNKKIYYEIECRKDEKYKKALAWGKQNKFILKDFIYYVLMRKVRNIAVSKHYVFLSLDIINETSDRYDTHYIGICHDINKDVIEEVFVDDDNYKYIRIG